MVPVKQHPPLHYPPPSSPRWHTLQSITQHTTKGQNKSSTRAHFLRFLSLSQQISFSHSNPFFPIYLFFIFLFLLPSLTKTLINNHTPLVFFLSLQGGGDCIQAGANSGALGRNSNGNQTASSNDSLTVTEHQVAKLMEEDMGSAMQYLQGKGLCLMPISLATAISTATCHSRNAMINNHNNNVNNNPLLQSNGEGPTSPSMSVLTVQSATMGNGGGDASVKDNTSVSKP